MVGTTISYKWSVMHCIKPFKHNVISHFYYLDQPVSILRVVRFSFYHNSNKTYCKQIVETLIRFYGV